VGNDTVLKMRSKERVIPVVLAASKRIDMAVVLITAAGLRLLLLFFFHADVGDTPTYELLAENILRGCGLSFSEPTSASCILASGGYFPGYPAFMALNWFLFGHSNFPVLLFQLGCYLFSLYWLLTALGKLTNSRKVVLSVGMLLAISPLQIGWFRFVITEPLAIAASTWFLAELVTSVAIGKIRKYHLALALSISVYIRPDTILMSVGVVLVAFHLYDLKNSVKQILIVGLLTSIPISGWMIRNLIIGHAPLTMTSEVAPKAPGYFSWLNTWVVNEYERADANFPVWRSEYSKINLHQSKYVNDDELKTAQLLIHELSEMDGKPFPNDIDKKFEELASLKIQTQNYTTPYAIFIERVAWLLFNPFSSWGLPLEIKDINKSSLKDAIMGFELNRAMSLLNGYMSIIAGKITAFSYRAIIFIGFILVVGHAFWERVANRTIFFSSASKVLVASAAAVAITRLAFFAYLGGLESRYLVEVVPWIEFCFVLWLVRKDRFFKGTRQSASIG
jgi:hypothetical protein